MDIVICNEETGQVQPVTINSNDELRALTEAYFGIMPENQVFKHNGKLIDNNANILEAGIVPGELISVKKEIPDSHEMGLVKDRLALESAITYTLLYLKGECNGTVFKMMIDTGASMSIITENVSKLIKVDHLMDTRLKGQAMGVGNSKILGVVCNCNVKLGDNIYVPANFRVIEDGFDPNLIILGLDFITSHRCIIDPFNRQIEVDGIKLRFLNEMEVENLKSPYNAIEKRNTDAFQEFCSKLTRKDETFQLLGKILSNIVNDPDESKYRSINAQSKVVKNLGDDSEALVGFLVAIGFGPKNDNPDKIHYVDSINPLVSIIDLMVNS